ncbi:hypothetical protein BJF78_16135 [Pseudonocardia sp. CNS-139]|nr:hypothetical protein BJF78_16135 [Pseudonocardia sp. CNS-139]
MTAVSASRIHEADTVPMNAVRGAGTTPGGRRAAIGGAVAFLCLVAVLLEATTDLLPDDSIVWVVTPVRLVLIAGLVAATAAGVRPKQWRTPLDLPILGLVLATAVATVVARQPWSPWRGVLTAVAVYYLVIGVRRALPGADRALGLLALVAVAIAATQAARQVAGEIPTGFCRGALDGSEDFCGPDTAIRAIGTFANPNLLAAFLLLLVPIAAAATLALADRASRLLGAAVVVLGYAAVLMTASRGGMMAAVAGTAVFVALRGPGRRVRIGLLAGAGAAALALLVALVTGASVGVRSDVWGAALRLLVTNPLGVGPGRAGALLDAAIPGEEAFQHTHNMWLNWAVETGVPGLAAIVALTVMAGLLVRRAARGGEVTAAAVGAGLAGFAVMSLADHPANAIRISLVMWALLALVVVVRPAGARKAGRRRAAPKPAEARHRGHDRDPADAAGARPAERAPAQRASARDDRPVEVRLQVDHPRVRHGLPDPRLGLVDRAGDGLQRQPRRQRDLGGDQQFLRADVLRADVDDRCTSPVSIADVIVESTGGAAPSPMSRLFISMIRMIAITPSSTPMEIVPNASKTGSPVSTLSPTPSSARTRPTSAPRSSSSTTGSSGTFDWRMNCHHVLSPLSGRDSWIAVRKEKISSTIATTRITTATIGDVSSSGCASFSMPSYRANTEPSVKSSSATMNE